MSQGSTDDAKTSASSLSHSANPTTFNFEIYCVMDYELRVIVEKVSVTSQTIIKRDTVKIYDIKRPESILELGLRHAEQIALLAKIQSSLLAEQSILVNLGLTKCPKCGQKISKNGFMKSVFHAVFSDHKLRLQKHRCKNPNCNWQSTPTTNSVFGTDTHPDLTKLQCEQGAFNSYRVAQVNLEKLNCQRRSVNNHVQIRAITHQIGEHLSCKNRIPPSPEELRVSARELIIQVERGFIPLKDNAKSEVLLGIVYQPDDHAFSELKACKSYVISAIDDHQQTMKTYLLNASLKHGLDKGTHVYAIADGTSSGWSVVSALQSHCQTLEPVLDWFHIKKAFKTAQHGLSLILSNFLEKS